MKSRKHLNQKRLRRAARNAAKIFGDAEKPRLAISRSNRYISAQLIDDVKAHTLVYVSGRITSGGKGHKLSKTKQASEVGKLVAEKAIKAGIKKAVFDRRSYTYHGRVRALAEAARIGGLKI